MPLERQKRPPIAPRVVGMLLQRELSPSLLDHPLPQLLLQPQSERRSRHREAAAVAKIAHSQAPAASIRHPPTVLRRVCLPRLEEPLRCARPPALALDEPPPQAGRHRFNGDVRLGLELRGGRRGRI